jgi:16S rRNA (uracil1498-N3)-methyltransferase
MLTRRTIVRRVNIERMRANAIEASEQSGRLSVPDTREAADFERLLSNWPAQRSILFCDETGEAPPIWDALRNAPGGDWAIFTGPEGGFLGVRILRADTAALAALAVWQAVKGDWQR